LEEVSVFELTELMQLHRRGNFVNKTSVFQHQIYITDKSGLAIFQSLPERYCRRFFIADHYPGSFRSNVVYMLPFSLQPCLSSADGSYIGHLNLNNNNVLTVTSGAAGTNGPYMHSLWKILLEMSLFPISNYIS